MPNELSKQAKRVINLLADGGALRVPFDDRIATLVVRPYLLELGFIPQHDDWNEPLKLIVDAETVAEVQNSGSVGIMTRRRHLNKVGWAEAGLDGTNAEFWCLVQ